MAWTRRQRGHIRHESRGHARRHADQRRDVPHSARLDGRAVRRAEHESHRHSTLFGARRRQFGGHLVALLSQPRRASRAIATRARQRRQRVSDAVARRYIVVLTVLVCVCVCSNRWFEADYDMTESEWNSGKGLFGFGSDDDTEATPLSSKTYVSAQHTHCNTHFRLFFRFTAYFRTKFTLDFEPSCVEDIYLKYTIDDGAIVYLNGQELWWMNMDPVRIYVYFAKRKNLKKKLFGCFDRNIIWLVLLLIHERCVKYSQKMNKNKQQ